MRKNFINPINTKDLFYIEKDSFSNLACVYGSRKDEDGFKVNQTGWCYLSNKDSSGFYKIKSIGDKDIFENTESMEITLEKAAPYDWINSCNPEEFFRSLMKLGFHVISRDVPMHRSDDNFNPIVKNERAWLAVSPERGCIIKTVEFENKFDGCYFTFVCPSEETRSIILRSSVLSSSSPYAFTVAYVGPNIFDLIKNIKIGAKPQTYDKEIFIFPFARFYIEDEDGRDLDLYENTTKKKEAFEKYYKMNRYYYTSLSKEVKEFLSEYTTVDHYFSKKYELAYFA